MIGSISMFTSIQDTTAPSVPTGLVASLITATTFTLTWSASTDSDSGVYSYTIYRNNSSQAVVYAPTVTANITGLSNGSTGSWTIEATDNANNISAKSSALSVTQLDTIAPSEPTNLASSNITDTTFTLSWTASTDNVGIANYKIYKDGVFIHQTTTSTSYNATGLFVGSFASWSVSAIDAASNESTLPTALGVQQTGGI